MSRTMESTLSVARTQCSGDSMLRVLQSSKKACANFSDVKINDDCIRGWRENKQPGRRVAGQFPVTDLSGADKARTDSQLITISRTPPWLLSGWNVGVSVFSECKEALVKES